VRLIVLFGPGGVADVAAGIVREKLGEKPGQRFVVENMPGAGGINAARAGGWVLHRALCDARATGDLLNLMNLKREDCAPERAEEAA
jgi:hypothetical protein